MQKPQPRRELLIETAARLFNEHGYRAVGIDTILARSGVSKATLYKYFGSKDDLIIEVLRRRRLQLEASAEERLQGFYEAHPDGEGRAAVLVFFDVLDEWIRSDAFFGCNFINSAAEFGAQDHPIHRSSAAYKAAKQARLELVLGSSVTDPQDVAQALMMVMEGAIVTAQVRGDRDAALAAKRIAVKILGLSS